MSASPLTGREKGLCILTAAECLLEMQAMQSQWKGGMLLFQIQTSHLRNFVFYSNESS